MKNFFTLFFISLITSTAFAQHITHGPVTGALTDSSARIYIRTSQATTCTLLIANDSLGNIVQQIPGNTLPELDSSHIFDIAGLDPFTYYYISFIINGHLDSIHGRFRTNPEPGKPSVLTFVTGSCQESENMKTFDIMNALQPHMLIHTGDFTYPSYQMNDDYPQLYSAVQESYRRRYQEKRMREMLRTVPIAYINDDDDGWGASRYKGLSYTRYTTVGEKKKIVNYMKTDTFPQLHRDNCFRAYREYFPGYAVPESQDGLYHTFTVGNCQFIFLDTRNTADCNADQFTFDSLSMKWRFDPKPENHLISTAQMSWLKKELLASKADWKFLVCGLPFNKNIRTLIDLGIKMQDLVVAGAGEKGTGFRLAASFATYWAGFPNDQQEVLKFIADNKIKDVLVISGDTHHNVMDDGQNAGLPELNASGLAVAGTHLAYYMNLLCKLSNYPSLKKAMWNGGGGGIKNKNFKNQFGKIDVIGKEKVIMSVVDEDGITISKMEIPHSSTVEYKGPKKIMPYQKRLDNKFGKKPGGWLLFEKSLAKLIWKP